MDIDMDSEKASRGVQVKFVTNLQPPYQTSSVAIDIPSNLTRFDLSTIVNDLIRAENDEWETEAFDFLIDGELVRMSLQEFLVAKGISAEKVVEVEYIKAVVPRKEEEPSPHDDWVSAVDGSSSKFILTGCYDGLGRIWKEAGKCTHILKGHTGAINSVCVIQPKVESSIGQVVATASKDMTVKLFKVNTNESSNKPKNVQAFKSLHGHSAAVNCISADPSGEKICSGSWDCRINLWRANESDFGGDSVSINIKKRKTEGDKESKTKEEAFSTLVGHTQSVSAVLWSEHDSIYSASWDHSIRKWDVETGKDSMNMYCGKAFNCLDVGGESSSLLAAGGSDPILRIWDPRKPGTLAPTLQFSSHTSWISSCKWHDSSWYHLVSASYDGKVMLWDLRTAWPLAIIDSHKDKVLCADWWRSDSVVSGGADKMLRISSEVSIV